jgi:hypothetical protein
MKPSMKLRLLPVAASLWWFSALLMAQRDIGRVVPPGQPLHVIAFGDFGTGSPQQAAVARAMAQRNLQEHFQLGITMGDNFYRCGVRSVNDEKWRTRWEDLYTPLGFPFYASLGNHDYGHPPIICPAERGSPEAEIAYTAHSNSWRMPSRYYSFKAGAVLFVAIDTEGWSSAQLAWIEKTLAEAAHDPTIKWKIVYGHHPVFTSGVHLNERRIDELRRELLPVMQAAHVDAYICGHDHDLEHLKSDGMDFFICGGGGARLRKFYRKEKESVFAASRFAFLDLEIQDHNLSAQFLDTDLKSLEHPVNLVK